MFQPDRLQKNGIHRMLCIYTNKRAKTTPAARLPNQARQENCILAVCAALKAFIIRAWLRAGSGWAFYLILSERQTAPASSEKE
jgi:hypothetical protein